MKVRAGTGGDEAALFAMDLFRMYQRHVAAQGWRWEQLSLLETEACLVHSFEQGIRCPARETA